MRWLRRAAIAALLCAVALQSAPLQAASAAASWQSLYSDLLAGRQGQTRAKRVVALIDLEGDGTPELAELAAVGGSSRTCKLSVFKVQSGAVVQMASGGFNFSSYAFEGVRTASFALRATGSLKPCLSIAVSGVSGGASVTTRLAFVKGGGANQLETVLFTTRAVKRGRSACTVGGAAATAARYTAAWSAFDAAYPRKGSGLPTQVFSAASTPAQIQRGVGSLAARFKSHATASKVSLSRTSLTLAYGATYALKAAVSPASAIYEQYTWKSSDETVVKVSGGALTAVGAGKATVTVRTTSGAWRSCAVTVTPPPAQSVSIAGDAHTVVRGQKLTLSAKALPEKASQAVKWTSTNPAVAPVSNGVVTGKKMGTTTIKATTPNGKTATFTVTVLAESLNAHGAIIDISRWNIVTNWDVLQKQVSFIILRCGVTYSASHELAGQMDDDVRFAGYAGECLKRGIPFGVYYYGMASTAEQARKEADKAYAVASRYNPLFYVYDAEEAVLTKAAIEAFAARLRQLGVRKVGAYIANHRYKQYNVKTSLFDFIWIPHYGPNTGSVMSTPGYACDLHQYSSKGAVPGVDGDVDVNRLMGTKPLSFFIS